MPRNLNRPTPEGRLLGEQIARFADDAMSAKRAAAPAYPERCNSCAFRLGTVPNGCPTTLMDALKCVLEVEPFMCHEVLDDGREPVKVCAGWAAMLTPDREPVKVPWGFSTECGAYTETSALALAEAVAACSITEVADA